MAIPETIKNYLDGEGLDYEAISHSNAITILRAAELAGIDAGNVAQAQAVKDWRGALLVVFPANYQLDLETLNRQLQREFLLTPMPAPLAAFQDCAKETLPPLPAIYGLKTIIDSSLCGIEPVYFQAGSRTELIRVSARGFALLQQNAWHGELIAQRIATPEPSHETTYTATPSTPARANIQAKIQRLTNLPPMPEMAQRILQLRANPYASANDLARIVTLDPSLAAQVIRYASSPLFGYRGNLDSIQDAISRVLGYDMVMDIAFGLAAGRAFRIPHDGPLGLHAFWRDAVYCAALAQSLSKLLPREQRLRPGLAYLAGLLHDFGFLLLGQLYPAEFARFNQALSAVPQQPLRVLELALLGVTHTELGTWLMEAWRMPVEIITAVREHHNAEYEGAYAGYPQLVRLAKQLLQRHDIGISEDDLRTTLNLKSLGLTEFQADAALESVVAGMPVLDDMAQQIAA